MVAVFILAALAVLLTSTATYFALDIAIGFGRYKTIIVNIDGVDTELYVQPTNWSKDIDIDGDEVTYGNNQRMYLTTVDKLDTSAYFKPNLLGGSMEFEVDMSQVGCNCVAALYGVRMPALDADLDSNEEAYCGA